MSYVVGVLQGMSFLQGGKEGSAFSKKIWDEKVMVSTHHTHTHTHTHTHKKAKYELMKSVRQSEGGSVSFVFIPFAFL